MHWKRLSFFLLLLLAACQCDDCFTGDATASFSASVEVQSIEFLFNDTVQTPMPVTGGSNITISIPIAYVGSGVLPVTLTRPPFYPNATNWTVFEDGAPIAVNVTNTTLSWTANLSVTNAMIHFQVQSPWVILDNVAESAVDYRAWVRVGSDDHLTNVKVSVQVSAGYPYWTLYEGNTDVTNTYNFRVAGNTASWQGFDLSERGFRLYGTKSRETGGGGGRHLWWLLNDTKNIPAPELPSDEPRFSVSPAWLDIALGDSAYSGSLHLVNLGSVPLTIWVESPDSWIKLSAEHLTLHPGRIKELPFSILGPGQGTIHLSSEEGEHVVMVNAHTDDGLSVTQIRILEQTPSPIQTVIDNTLLNLILLSIITLLLAVYFHMTANNR
ncbi:hypothetical protein GOV07_04055 [Candidatus Woesearchaeota archaeon]|nr:hypothetical protein [Candidatus Woesearchaeota archaeon]